MDARPRLSYAVITVIIMIVLLSLCAVVPEKLLPALTVGAGAFGLITVFLLYMLWRESNYREMDTITSFADALSRLDPEGREILADKFPNKVRYTVARGELRKTVDDTGVPVEFLVTFLKDSNDRYISPLRNWYTSEKPERYWWLLKNWMERKGYVVEDSAAGNHSYLWAGASYGRLCAYWLMVDRHLADMSDWEGEAVGTPQQAYAYDTNPLPHFKNASEEA